jgi:hypothetical protein
MKKIIEIPVSVKIKIALPMEFLIFWSTINFLKKYKIMARGEVVKQAVKIKMNNEVM